MLYLQCYTYSPFSSARYSIHRAIRDKCRVVQTAILLRNYSLQKRGRGSEPAIKVHDDRATEQRSHRPVFDRLQYTKRFERFCVLQVQAIKNWTVGRPGNKAKSVNTADWQIAFI